MKLSKAFYQGNDVVLIARELIGKYLFTNAAGCTTGGLITETEAYNGVVDKASHAYNGRKTQRTEVMFRAGGVGYIYLCYGIHSLFNVVTNDINVPEAVLIRSIWPTHGIDEILRRRGQVSLKQNTGMGPGNVSAALGIHYGQTGVDLTGDKIWIEDQGVEIPDQACLVGRRIGVDYAGNDASLPYRFQVKKPYYTEIKNPR